MSEGERRLAAIMYTDIVGYTSLTQKDESSTLQALEKHRSLLRPLFTGHGGREIKTIGDAFLVEFQSALDAVLCATAIQQMMHDRKVATGEAISLRVGIHVGDVVEKGNDILGDAVNIASRICPLAEPGGICMTSQVYEQVRNKSDLPFVSLGERSLKNVSTPVGVYKARMPWEQSTTTEALAFPTNRIAILPFVSMSPDPNDEYFADGLTEELIAKLSLLGGMEVIARTSTMNYKKKEKSVSQIGSELGAGTLLEGSVRKAGNRIRVTAQLINSNTQAHLWADSYDSDLEDVFAVQVAIAEKVAKSLELRLFASQREQFKRRETRNPEAHIEYLRGQHLVFRYDEDGMRGAIRHFERAVELEPDYAAAIAYLSSCYTNLGYLGFEPMNDALSKAKELALKALELDETSPEAHFSLSFAAFFDCDWSRSEAEIKRALEINPSYADAHVMYCVILQNLGPMDRAVSEIRRALELDPLSFVAQDLAGCIFSVAKMHEEALAHFKNALELEPQSPIAHSDFGFALFKMGRVEEGVREIERATTMSGDSFFYKGNLGNAYAMAGRRDDALRIAEEMRQASDKVPVFALGLAGIYGNLKDKESALNWLEKAYKEHSLISNPLFSTWPEFEFIRQEPRFKELLRKTGLDTFRIA